MFSTRLFSALLALSSVASIAWLYPSLPARVPTRYDLLMRPIGYGPKTSAWIIPIILLIVGLIAPLTKAWLRRGASTPEAEARDAARHGAGTFGLFLMFTLANRAMTPPPQRPVIVFGAIVTLAGFALFAMATSDASNRVAWPLAVGAGIGLMGAGVNGCTMPFALAFLTFVIALYGALSIWSERTSVVWR